MLTIEEQKFWYLLGLIGFVLKMCAEEAARVDGTFLGEGYGTLVNYERHRAAWSDIDTAESLSV